jgi:large subunit ribosomal protein L10
VQQLSELRKQLRQVAARYDVVKNRLARLAMQASALEVLSPHLRGPIGVVIARQDPVAVAKALATFSRTNPALALRAGVVDGQSLDAAGLKALADLPSRDVLRARLVAAVQGPLTQLVGLLTAPHRELVDVLDQRGKAAAPQGPEGDGH